VLNAFIQVAFNIKNFFLAIAVIFLIIGVLKLLFAGGDEEKIKRWKSNIIYVSIGIFIMQLAFSVWNSLMINDPNAGISSILGWQMWVNVFSPLVGMLQVLASFGFFAMMVYAFFMIVTGGGDEEKLKK
jgi:Type IV secretion system pilin